MAEVTHRPDDSVRERLSAPLNEVAIEQINCVIHGWYAGVRQLEIDRVCARAAGNPKRLALEMPVDPLCGQLANRLIDGVVQGKPAESDRCGCKKCEDTRAQRVYAPLVRRPPERSRKTHARTSVGWHIGVRVSLAPHSPKVDLRRLRTRCDTG